MGDYSFLADMLNKFHTSKPLIQLVLAVVTPLFLLGLGWYLKEICIAFANSIEKAVIAFANKGQPEGDLAYSVYRNDADEWVVYYNNPTPTQIDSHNVVILPTGAEPKQIGGQIEEKTDDNGGANESVADDNSNGEGRRSI